jgi:predicted Zn-dependent protease
LAGLYQNFPGNHAISIAYCDALLRDNRPGSAETASTILREQLMTYPDDPALYVLYAGASNNAGNTVRAREAIAESYYQRPPRPPYALALVKARVSITTNAREFRTAERTQIELVKLGMKMNLHRNEQRSGSL